MNNPYNPAQDQPQPGNDTPSNDRPGFPPQPGSAPGSGVTPPPPPPPASTQDMYGQESVQPQFSQTSGQGDYGQGGYGQDSTGGYVSPTGYQPETREKRSGGALAGIIAGTLGVALGLGGGYLIWGGGDSDAKPSATSSPQQTTEPTETPDPTDSPEPTSPAPETSAFESPEPSSSVPALEGDAGTRKNPLAIGTEVTVEDWSVTLAAPKDGTKIIAEEAEWNTPVKDGSEYYLVPMTAVYQGDESGLAWLDIRVGFVSDDGRTYTDRCPVQFPDDLSDIGELYEGGKAEGNACVVVPAGANGLWTVSSFMGDQVFFSAK